MADKKQVALLRQGVREWNAWREGLIQIAALDGDAHLISADLEEADLVGTNLVRANLVYANLQKADLSGAHLADADLERANLRGAKLNDYTNLERTNLWGANLTDAQLKTANLNGAHLSSAILSRANLSGAQLIGADLRGANLFGADLEGAVLAGTCLIHANLEMANLHGAKLNDTVFADSDLSAVTGLETCEHYGPSIIDVRTLQQSDPLPLEFLRGVGLPDSLIAYLPSLLNQPLQMYSCFISYSSKDRDFAERLYADLQNKGVRCWFAPRDLPIGAKTWDSIDEAIKLRDKLLLILSENSIISDWVEDEVSKAFAEERDREQLVLLPVRIDDCVMETPEPWARKLRDQRHIGDFTKWRDRDAYQASLDRLLRDLARA